MRNRKGWRRAETFVCGIGKRGECLVLRHPHRIFKFIIIDGQLVAIGIGHDVTRYYKRAVTITDPGELAGAMTDKLVELFEEDAEMPTKRHKPQRRKLQ